MADTRFNPVWCIRVYRYGVAMRELPCGHSWRDARKSSTAVECATCDTEYSRADLREPTPSDETISMPVEQFRLLVELAGVCRKHNSPPMNLAPFIGGTARANAARQAHDKARALLRESDSE